MKIKIDLQLNSTNKNIDCSHELLVSRGKKYIALLVEKEEIKNPKFLCQLLEHCVNTLIE